jgi:hypothetical protein
MLTLVPWAMQQQNIFFQFVVLLPKVPGWLFTYLGSLGNATTKCFFLYVALLSKVPK